MDPANYIVYRSLHTTTTGTGIIIFVWNLEAFFSRSHRYQRPESSLNSGVYKEILRIDAYCGLAENTLICTKRIHDSPHLLSIRISLF